MTRLQKTPLRPLTRQEQQELTRVAKATSARIDEVRRAQALLSVADGQPFTQAARRAGFRSSVSVGQLVARFNQHGLAALTIAPGRGSKLTYDAAIRQRILETVRQPPQRAVDGTATWSLHSLQQALRSAPDGFPRLGMTTIHRILREAGYSYQRTRTWCPTGTAQRVRKDGVVTVYDPQTEEKKTHRASLSHGRRARHSGLVSG
jgi:transposase